MFKAITKDKAGNANNKGTLSALWSKKSLSKIQEGEDNSLPSKLAPSPTKAADPFASAERPVAGIELSPEPAGRINPKIDSKKCAAESVLHTAAVSVVHRAYEEEDEAKLAITSAKSKKRSRHGSITSENMAKLEASFAISQYPNTTAKEHLASSLGLETVTVHKWFENQRKRAREESGTTTKRGRPRGDTARTSGIDSAQTHAISTHQKVGNAPEAGEAATPTVKENHIDKAEDAVMDAVVLEAKSKPDVAAQTPYQQPLPDSKDPSVGDAAAAAGADTMMSPAPATFKASDAETQAQDAADAVPQAAATPRQPVLEHSEDHLQDSVTLMSLKGDATTIATPKGGHGSADKSTLKVRPPSAANPVVAATQHVLSIEEAAKVAQELETEMDRLQREGLGAMLLELPGAAPEPTAFCDGKLASFVAGQKLPLSQLVAAVQPLFRAPGNEAPVEEAVLRSKIIELAGRKSYGPKDGGSALVDALEDSTVSHLWQWEVRDTKVLPKEFRAAAVALKKRAAKVQDRLSALNTALIHLRSYGEGSAAPKLSKALDALNKTKGLDEIVAELEEQANKCAKSATKKMQSAAKPKVIEENRQRVAEEKLRRKAEKEAEKERAKAEREEEKERIKAEKERKKAEEAAEKERKKAEEAAEKEKKKAEEAAEKERRRAEEAAGKEKLRKEQEMKRELKKTGFSDAAAKEKAASKFTSFFKSAAAKDVCTPAPKARKAEGTAADAATPSFNQQGDRPTQGGPQVAGGSVLKGGTTAKKKRGFADIFLPPPNNDFEPPAQAADSLDASLAAGQEHSHATLQGHWQHWLAASRSAKKQERANRILGLPSPWARYSNARERAQEHLQRLLEGGLALSEIKCLKRKFLWFDGDRPYSVRPAYYGSRTQDVPAIPPRNFLRKDTSLDYEVMSDLDWEEEPEGEELSGGAVSMSDVSDGGSDANDSFVVDTGYLSEDEGIKSDAEDDTEADSGDAAALAACYGDDLEAGRMAKRRQQLELHLERARRLGKPYIVSRLHTPDIPEGQPCPFIPGDSSLLEALSMEVLVPGALITMPPDPAAPAAEVAATPGIAVTPARGVTGKGEVPKSGGTAAKMERPEELLPDLAAFMHTNPKTSKQKVVDALLEAHSSRKIVKKWVQDKIRELAEWTGGQWVLKPEGTALLPHRGSSPAAQPAADVVAAADAAAMPAAGEPPEVSHLQTPVPAATSTHTKTTTGGPLDRFLKRGTKFPSEQHPTTQRDPAGERAPERLTTAMAAAGAGRETRSQPGVSQLLHKKPRHQAPQLSIPNQVSSTCDPFWHQLVQQVEGADTQPASNAACSGWPYEAAFAPEVLDRHVAALPAFVLTALVSGLQSCSSRGGSSAALRASYARCLGHAVTAIARHEESAVLEGEEPPTASQQVWATSSTSPLPASLKELAREPHLLHALLSCLVAASAGTADVQAVDSHQQRLRLEAAKAALEVSAALLDTKEAKGALLKSGEGGDRGPEEEQGFVHPLAALGKAAGQVVGVAVWQGDHGMARLARGLEKSAAAAAAEWEGERGGGCGGCGNASSEGGAGAIEGDG